jgi:reactive intermediate/imine deaminase
MNIIQLKSSATPSPLAHYSQGVRVDGFVFPAGQIASDYRTGVPPEAGADAASQAAYVLKNLAAVLAEAGCGLEHVVKAQVFLRDLAHFQAFDAAWKEFFPSPPSRTAVQVGPQGLLVPGCEVEIDLVAAHPDASIQSGAFLFPAGEMAGDPQSGVPPEARSHPAFPYYSSGIERQTSYALSKLESVLRQAGADLSRVVKGQVFLTGMAEFDGFFQVWSERLPHLPPLTVVPVAGLLVPGCRVEIDLIAVAPGGGMKPRRIRPRDLPEPFPQGNVALVAAPLVFASGQLAADFEDGLPGEARVNPHSPFLGTDIARQTEVILTNLSRLLRQAGTSLERVVKAQVFLTDLNLFYQFDKVWKRFFPLPPPRTTVQIGGPTLLLPECLVQVDVIAAVK